MSIFRNASRQVLTRDHYIAYGAGVVGGVGLEKASTGHLAAELVVLVVGAAVAATSLAFSQKKLGGPGNG